MIYTCKLFYIFLPYYVWLWIKCKLKTFLPILIDFSSFAKRRSMLGVVFANNFINGDFDCEP